MTGIYSARDIEKLVKGSGLSGGGGGTIDGSQYVAKENGEAINLTTKGLTLFRQEVTPEWVPDIYPKVAEFMGDVEFENKVSFDAAVEFEKPEEIVWNYDDGKVPTTRTIQQKNLKSICKDIDDIKEAVEKIKVPDTPPATGTPIDTSNLATKEEIATINTNIAKLQNKTQFIAETGFAGGKFDFWISEKENALATEIVQAARQFPNKISTIETEINDLKNKSQEIDTKKLDEMYINNLYHVGTNIKDSTKLYLTPTELENLDIQTKALYNWNHAHVKSKQIGQIVEKIGNINSKVKAKCQNLNKDGHATKGFKVISTTNEEATSDQIVEGIKTITTLADTLRMDENGFLERLKIKSSFGAEKTGDQIIIAVNKADTSALKTQKLNDKGDFEQKVLIKEAEFGDKSSQFSKCATFYGPVENYAGLNFTRIVDKKGPLTFKLTPENVNGNYYFSFGAPLRWEVSREGSTPKYRSVNDIENDLKKSITTIENDITKANSIAKNISPAVLKFGTHDKALYFDAPAYFHWGFYLKTILENDLMVMKSATVKTETKHYVVDSAWIAQFFLNTLKQRQVEEKFLLEKRKIEKVEPYTLRTLALEDEIVDEPTNTETTEEEDNKGATGTEEDPIYWDGSKMKQINQEYEETWKETMDYLHTTIDETYNDIKANYQTNKQIGNFCRNSLFCESMKGKIPLKPLKPQELASYGFVEFAQSDLEMYDEGGCFYNILVSGKELSQTESKLDISLQGLKHYSASHFILHLFDRQRNQKIYDLNCIDHVFEFILSNNNLTVKSDLSSDLYTFTYTNTEDELKVSITGSLKLKLVYDASDNQYWNADEGWEKKEDKELENRLIVYYELPINENFKNFLASLGTGGGSVDSSIYSRVSDLEKIINDLTQTFQEHNTKIDYKMENEKFESLSPQTYAIEDQEGEKKEPENTNIFDKWVSTTSDQFDYFNQGIKDIWLFCAGMSLDIGNLEDSIGSGTATDFSILENKIKVLEKKCENIEGDSPTLSTGELTIENLMKSYNERITILEKKCQNIK